MSNERQTGKNRGRRERERERVITTCSHFTSCLWLRISPPRSKYRWKIWFYLSKETHRGAEQPAVLEINPQTSFCTRSDTQDRLIPASDGIKHKHQPPAENMYVENRHNQNIKNIRFYKTFPGSSLSAGSMKLFVHVCDEAGCQLL